MNIIEEDAEGKNSDMMATSQSMMNDTMKSLKSEKTERNNEIQKNNNFC